MISTDDCLAPQANSLGFAPLILLCCVALIAKTIRLAPQVTFLQYLKQGSGGKAASSVLVWGLRCNFCVVLHRRRKCLDLRLKRNRNNTNQNEILGEKSLDVLWSAFSIIFLCVWGSQTLIVAFIISLARSSL